MARTITNQTVRFRVDFTSICSIGPGKIELLETIARTGSLSQSARALGLSYRRAWLMLDDLNHSFTGPVARSSVGGHLRGGMTLTSMGKDVIRCYRSAARAIESVVHSELATVAAKAVKRTSRYLAASRKRLPRRLLATDRAAHRA
jgi:molybdate transport system regulatory protein